MKQITGKVLAKALERKGWSLSRVRGSRHVYVKADRRERIVIPIHGNNPLKLGLLKAQMKIAGLIENDL